MGYIDKLLKEPQNRQLLAQEVFVVEIVAKICEYMERHNISRTELARRMGKNRSFITQILSGERNFQINTLAGIIYSLGAGFKVSIYPQGAAYPFDDQDKWLTGEQLSDPGRVVPPGRSNRRNVISINEYKQAA